MNRKMKNSIFIVLTIFTFSIYGQESDKKKLNFQFDLGTTISIPFEKDVEFKTLTPINGSYKTNYSSDFGYYLELITSYNINNRFIISSGINYNYTSIKIKDGEGIITSEGNLTNSYINIPLLFKYKILPEKPLYISTGGYLGFLINANEKGTTYLDTTGFVVIDPNDPLLQPQDYDNNVNADFENLDFGLLIQLDYEIKFSEKISGVFLSRFNYGLTNVISTGMDKKEMKHSAAYEWKNYNIIIGFGIKI
jgi:hypothetical protein